MSPSAFNFGDLLALFVINGLRGRAANNVLEAQWLRPPSTMNRLRLTPAWICAVLVGGVVLSLGLFGMIRGWERRELQGRAANLAHSQVEKLQVSILRSMEVLYSIASLHVADGRLERNQFGQFVGQALMRQPELQERLKKMSAETFGGSAEKTANYMRQEVERWGDVIKAADIKLQ